MSREHTLSRRKFIGGAAAVGLGATAVGGLAQRATGNTTPPRIPAENRGIILVSVRDRISAAPDTTGIPYGFERVLARLAEIGYKTIEFAGYNQSTQILGRQITPAEIRTILDNNGLNAVGNHGNVPGSITDANLATFRNNCQIAATLGQEFIGTGGDPTGSAFKADWDAAIERWNILGAIAKNEFGLGLYTHNHDNAYNFLLDSGPLDDLGRPTRSSGLRRDEYFAYKSEPYVIMEMDIYWAHVAQHRFRSYTNPDGDVVENIFDPAGLVAKRTHKFRLFHAKDGLRTADPPGVGSGYVFVPFGTGNIDFKTFFDRIGGNRSKFPMWEQDNAPGGSANPAQSLTFAQISYNNMAALGAIGT